MKYRISSVITILILTISFSFSLTAQEHHDDHDHDKEHHKHNNEISLAIGIVPLPTENEISFGIHAHYIKGLGKQKRIGLGLSLETIFDEHKHYTISGISHFNIYKGFNFSYAAGLLFVKEESIFEKRFAQHFELNYEFEIGQFHLGPMVEIGLESTEIHYMAGIHFGFDF